MSRKTYEKLLILMVCSTYLNNKSFIVKIWHYLGMNFSKTMNTEKIMKRF